MDVQIRLTDGGGAFIQPARADSVNTSKISGGVAVETDDGTIYVQRTGIVVTIDGAESATAYNSLADALTGTADETGTVVITLLPQEGGTASYELASSAVIGANQSVRVMDGATLKVTVSGNDYTLLTDSQGTLEIQQGGTLNMPVTTPDPGYADYVGDDDDARMNLSQGVVTFDFGTKTMTLDGEATVPSGKTFYLLLGDQAPINGVITEGSQLTVADNGTLRLISGGEAYEAGSQLTIDGTLTVDGLLSTGAKAAVTVSGTGTLDMKQLSKDEMADIKSPITVQSGAAMTYDTWTVTGGEDALVQLENGSAVLDMTGAGETPATVSLTLNGTGSIQDDTLALLVATDGSLVPFDITVAEDSVLTIPEGITLDLPNNAALRADGTVTVAGTLDVGTTTLTGTIEVTGTGTVHFPDDALVQDDTNVTLNVAEGGKVENWESASQGAATITVKEEEQSGGNTGSTGSSSGSSSYTITTEDTDNGSISVSPSRASSGRTVTITVEPDDGYALDELSVTDSKGEKVELTKVSDTKYTFTMPRSRVTIEAAFVEINHADTCPSADFTDVDMDAWYHDAVDYAIENGMMNGIGNNLFAPESNLNRAMLVQVLWNLEGNPDTSAITEYSDVASDAWYYNAVQWATAENIVGGYGNGIYGPEDDITREQMALMLYRYAQYKGYDTTQSGADVQGFNDYEDISDWALEGVTWAVNAGLLNGKGNGILDPIGDATRAEVAQILMNFCENIVE